MERLFQLSCFLCVLIVFCSTEAQNDFSEEVEIPQHVYNIDALLKRTFANVKSSLQYKDLYPYLKLAKDQNFLQEALERLDLLQNSTNSSKCAWDISYIIESLLTKEQWALQLLDSWGKPESGILRGNVHWVGDYTECMKVYAPKDSANGDFHGQYCTLTYSIGNSSDANPMKQALAVALCLPDSCSPTDFFKPANTSDDSQNTTSPFKMTCQQRERHMNGPAKAVVALLCLFGILAIAGSSITVVKYFMEVIKQERRSSLILNIPPSPLIEDQKDPINNHVDADNVQLLQENKSSGKCLDFLKSCEPFLECFCVFKNGAKLLNTKTSEGELVCIHGIRFLSMSWVILGHTYIFGIAEIRNTLGLLDLVKNWPFQVLLEAFYSVDSFFVLSGFLLTYLCMQELNKNGKINWPYFYIHRYLRLTPVYMIVLGFFATINNYLGAGPFWPQYDVDPICQKHWWWNLIYINNFNSQATMCMGWSWYLANDMQFFVISPIILITLWKWPKVGLSILASMMCASWISNFYLTYHYDLIPGMAGILTQPPSAETLGAMSRFADYFEKLYIKPYTRICAYLVGMLTGYILFARKRSHSPRHSLITISIGWMIATTITLACTYGLYHQNPGLLGRSFFNTLNRTTWATGLCWVIYVCLVDQGGIVNDILSIKVMIPLSRLTYAAYLIHPMVITGYYATLKATIEATHPTLVTIFLGLMVITYALALPVALVLESPVIALEKLIRKKFSKRQ